MEKKQSGNEEFPMPVEMMQESPRHGFQGDRGAPVDSGSVPAALTIALSRESGARGSTIARRAGEKLGWQMYDQELLEYIAQEGELRQEVIERLPPAAAVWVEEQLQQHLKEQSLSQHPSIVNLARVVLALGARGEVMVIGRGAGLILPRPSTLHVRIVAPLHARIAYMSQWLRLTFEEAAEKVRVRDMHRTEYLAAHFHQEPNDVYSYDLILNSSLLGEDLCADLIVQAARAKQAVAFPKKGGLDGAPICKNS